MAIRQPPKSQARTWPFEQRSHLYRAIPDPISVPTELQPFHQRKATAAPTTGTTLTTSPSPANSGGILAFPNTPAASRMAAKLYTKLQAKLNTTLRWNAFDKSIKVRMPFNDGLMRTASAAD